MPSGAGRAGRFLFSTVGRNRCVVIGRSPAGFERSAVAAMITTPAVATDASNTHHFLKRLGGEAISTGGGRRLVISWL